MATPYRGRGGARRGRKPRRGGRGGRAYESNSYAPSFDQFFNYRQQEYPPAYGPEDTDYTQTNNWYPTNFPTGPASKYENSSNYLKRKYNGDFEQDDLMHKIMRPSHTESNRLADTRSNNGEPNSFGTNIVPTTNSNNSAEHPSNGNQLHFLNRNTQPKTISFKPMAASSAENGHELNDRPEAPNHVDRGEAKKVNEEMKEKNDGNGDAEDDSGKAVKEHEEVVEEHEEVVEEHEEVGEEHEEEKEEVPHGEEEEEVLHAEAEVDNEEEDVEHTAEVEHEDNEAVYEDAVQDIEEGNDHEHENSANMDEQEDSYQQQETGEEENYTNEESINNENTDQKFQDEHMEMGSTSTMSNPPTPVKKQLSLSFRPTPTPKLSLGESAKEIAELTEIVRLEKLTREKNLDNRYTENRGPEENPYPTRMQLGQASSKFSDAPGSALLPWNNTASMYLPASFSAPSSKSLNKGNETLTITLPRGIISLFNWNGSKKPPLVKNRQESIIYDSMMTPISGQNRSLPKLNIFKFDYTMVSSAEPNRDLYHPATYDSINISPPNIKRGIFDWYSEILPFTDIASKDSYVSSELVSYPSLHDAAIAKKIDVKSISSLPELKYRWSKLMLAYVAASQKDGQTSNMLIIDRYLANKNKLLHDLRILEAHGIVFHFIVSTTKARNSPSILMLSIIDEIYNKRFSWCEKITKINYFDGLGSMPSYKELNPNSSRIIFKYIKSPKLAYLLDDPSEELRLVMKKFKRVSRPRDLMVMTRSGAFFEQDIEHSQELWIYLNSSDLFPKTDLSEFKFDLQRIYLSHNNVPAVITNQFQQDNFYSASILSVGKIDKLLYVVRFLISVEVDTWEFNAPIMVVARHRSINQGKLERLLNKLEWTDFQCPAQFKFAFHQDMKVKITS